MGTYLGLLSSIIQFAPLNYKNCGYKAFAVDLRYPTAMFPNASHIKALGVTMKVYSVGTTWNLVPLEAECYCLLADPWPLRLGNCWCKEFF